MRVILRGGPFTGEIHDVGQDVTTFTARDGAARPVSYEATGRWDRATELPILVYRMPLLDLGDRSSGGVGDAVDGGPSPSAPLPGSLTGRGDVAGAETGSATHRRAAPAGCSRDRQGASAG